MKRLLTILICLLSISAMAQEPQIIGGYLLDGKDSFEETHAKIPITLSPNGERISALR